MWLLRLNCNNLADQRNRAANAIRNIWHWLTLDYNSVTPLIKIYSDHFFDWRGAVFICQTEVEFPRGSSRQMASSIGDSVQLAYYHRFSLENFEMDIHFHKGCSSVFEKESRNTVKSPVWIIIISFFTQWLSFWEVNFPRNPNLDRVRWQWYVIFADPLCALVFFFLLVSSSASFCALQIDLSFSSLCGRIQKHTLQHPLTATLCFDFKLLLPYSECMSSHSVMLSDLWLLWKFFT